MPDDKVLDAVSYFVNGLRHRPINLRSVGFFPQVLPAKEKCVEHAQLGVLRPRQECGVIPHRCRCRLQMLPAPVERFNGQEVCIRRR